MSDADDRSVSLEEALQHPEDYNLSSDDIARIKRLQFGLRGWDIPKSAGKQFHWKSQLLLNKTKDPIGHIANLTLILSNDERWLLEDGTPLLAWNQLRNQISWRGLPCWSSAYAGEHSPNWSDEDADRLVTWLGLTYQIKTPFCWRSSLESPSICLFSLGWSLAPKNRWSFFGASGWSR